MEWLYYSVLTGHEAQISIDSNSKPDYRAGLEKELEAMRNQEMWRAGAVVRQLRPENSQD
jgi:ketol-acid reductoisomerase